MLKETLKKLSQKKRKKLSHHNLSNLQKRKLTWQRGGEGEEMTNIYKSVNNKKRILSEKNTEKLF